MAMKTVVQFTAVVGGVIVGATSIRYLFNTLGISS